MAVIAIASPVRPTANSGNDVTSARWETLLRSAGHEVHAVPVEEDGPTLSADAVRTLSRADVLIALHARRCAPATRWWSRERRGRPLVVGMAGTDLYDDLPGDADARFSVEKADALIVLQEDAIARLATHDPAWASKANVIHQSVAAPLPERRPIETEFRVVVLAHLRSVKDPFLAARAARDLPAASTVAVHHAGRAFDERWETLAVDEETSNGRYTWHRELDAAASLRLLASATVLACTSTSEGGANVVTEAIALGVPVIGTRIGGNTGLLGEDHPGLFPVGDHVALRELLIELETRPDRLVELEQRSIERRPLTDPMTEARLLDALVGRVVNS